MKQKAENLKVVYKNEIKNQFTIEKINKIIEILSHYIEKQSDIMLKVLVGEKENITKEELDKLKIETMDEIVDLVAEEKDKYSEHDSNLWFTEEGKKGEFDSFIKGPTIDTRDFPSGPNYNS